MNKKLNKGLLLICGIILSLILICWIVHDYRTELYLLFHLTPHNKAVLLHLIRSHGLGDMLLLLALIATFNAIPGMSNSFVCIFVGLCYGPLTGFVINWLGNILGNCGVISVINRVNLSKRSKQSKLLATLLNQRHPLVGLTIGYMVPVIPSILVNYAATRLKVGRLRYLAMVTIGMMPTSFIYAFGGDALFRGDNKRLLIAIAAIVIVIAMAILVKKLVKCGRHVAAS